MWCSGLLIQINVACAPGAHGHVQFVHGVREELVQPIPALSSEPAGDERTTEGVTDIKR